MIGQTLSHYKVVDKIGEGGMSIVYKAEDTRLKRPVALKFLSPATLDDVEQKQRFSRRLGLPRDSTIPTSAPYMKSTKSTGELSQLVELSQSRYVPSVYLAHVYSALGDLDKAFEILDQGYAVRDRHLVFVKCSPEMAPRREDPRFQQLLEKIGFPD